MLFGLLLGNLIDLDHIYYRLIGKVGWFKSACPEIGMQCSFGFYPLHNWIVLVISLIFFPLIFSKNKKIKFIGWLSLGVFLNLVLDLIHLFTGIGI
jgi:hypothetical protein